MLTLVINAPKTKVQEENKQSFEKTFRSGIGDEYAIWSHWVPLLVTGSRVVLLSKDEELRAEGELLELIPKSKTGSGIQRYDVHIKNLKMVPYKPERLNRNGVAII
jgi:hypothetical protein